MQCILIHLDGKNLLGFAKSGIKEEYSFKRSNAFAYVQKECENVQNNIGVLDLSTFAKYEISGKDSETFLERLCANRIPKKDGSIIFDTYA